MSAQGTIFGCIYGSGPIGSPNINEFYEHNRKIIGLLPEKIGPDTLVSRNMFSVPMPDWGAFYRYQMIHFGASFNHLDAIWEDWLIDFEVLLRQLFWFESYVYMTAEIYAGHTQYHWQAHISPLFENPPQPIQSWNFTGGPRNFEG